MTEADDVGMLLARSFAAVLSHPEIDSSELKIDARSLTRFVLFSFPFTDSGFRSDRGDLQHWGIRHRGEHDKGFAKLVHRFSSFEC